MAKYIASYKCSCGATREIIFDSERVGRAPGMYDFPDTVVCGVRGHEASMPRVSREALMRSE